MKIYIILQKRGSTLESTLLATEVYHDKREAE